MDNQRGTLQGEITASGAREKCGLIGPIVVFFSQLF